MKYVLFFILLVSFTNSYCQDIGVMTYNIKYDNKSDTVNNWNDRKADMVRLLKHYKPDIFGTQEALHHQVVFLDNSLTTYSYIGVGRDDGKQKGEYSSIHFDSTKYKVLKTNTFWLSPTPEKISVGWDAAMERICTYGLFEELKSEKQFYVFNTHFDHKGVVAREKSATLILQKISAINIKNLPIVLMGDFNLAPNELPIKHLSEQLMDGLTITTDTFYGPTGTFNGFNTSQTLDKRIDYIFVKYFSVKSYLHIDDRMENNKHISDHLPVMAVLSY